MPAIISFGMININSPQQNAGVFIGEINIGGWDANMKINSGHAALFGFYNVAYLQYNLTFDNLEFMDALINDQDFKPSISSNI